MLCRTLFRCLLIVPITVAASIAHAQAPTPLSQYATVAVKDPIYSHMDSTTLAENRTRNAEITQLQNDAHNALTAGHYTFAETFARDALALSPDGVGYAGPILAEALDAQGKDAEALAAYDKFEKWDNEDREFMLRYALELLNANRWSDAVAAYSKAIPPLTAHDLLEIQQGSRPDTEYLRRDNQFSGDDPQPIELAASIHTALGVILRGKNDAASLLQFEQALQLTPDSDVTQQYYQEEIASSKQRADTASELGSKPKSTATP